MEEGRSETLLIKEERLDVGNIHQPGGPMVREERLDVLNLNSGGGNSIVGATSLPAEGAQEHGKKDKPWPVIRDSCRMEARTEKEKKTVHKTILHTGSELQIQKMKETLTKPWGEFSRSNVNSQIETLFKPLSINTPVDNTCCSYTVEINSESMSFPSELYYVPVKKESPENCLVGAQTAKLSSTMAMPTVNEAHDLEDTEGEMSPENATHNCPPYIEITHQKNQCRLGVRKKKYICAFCGKGFTGPTNLEAHLRIHTGEKPFSCTQCGKQFTQLGNLKIHMNVHTGERPFCCLVCGESFSHPSNLKRHQKRLHREEQ